MSLCLHVGQNSASEAVVQCLPWFRWLYGLKLLASINPGPAVPAESGEFPLGKHCAVRCKKSAVHVVHLARVADMPVQLTCVLICVDDKRIAVQILSLFSTKASMQSAEATKNIQAANAVTPPSSPRSFGQGAQSAGDQT